MNILQTLKQKNILDCPDWLPLNTHWVVIMGSVAYGVATDYSDFDVYGWAIPPKVYLFPHTEGYLNGFGKPAPKFNQFQKHHVLDEDALGGKGRQYDFSIYNIVKYFQLCMDGNPNMVDSLFVPRDCVLFSSQLGETVRNNRHLFLSKQMFSKFRGYAFSQLHKMKNKNRIGKRQKAIDKYGFDLKYAYHLIRLLDELEQILTTQDLDLRRNKEQLKAIRRGDYKEEDIYHLANEKEKLLEKVQLESDLQQKPNEKLIKELLLDCLEKHYGNLDSLIVKEDEYLTAIGKIRGILEEI